LKELTRPNPTVGSLFAGIGGFDLGLERAGFDVLWSSDIEPTGNKVRRRHWPGVKQYGDITKIDPSELAPVDLICGGFPCQDLSVAGARKGLAGERSGLFFEATRLVGALKPRWVLIENVPGLFSSANGRDFETVIRTLEDLGYGVAWRVLDSQHFGVPQRRRRVFVVGYLGAPCPPEILFEPESLRGDSKTGRHQRQGITESLKARADSSGRDDWAEPFVARALTASGYLMPDRSLGTVVTETLRVGGREQGAEVHNVIAFDWQAGPGVDMAIGDKPLRANRWGGSDSHGDEGNAVVGSPTNTPGVRAATGIPGRLDPDERREPDGPRERALGNAVTVPVITWIGRRIRAAHPEAI
jgi:site-specific DNA-cytosine methylase